MSANVTKPKYITKHHVMGIKAQAVVCTEVKQEKFKLKLTVDWRLC